MAIRTVLQLGDPGLREVARRVNDPAAAEIRELVEDLSDTLAYWRKTTGYGRGIAAPQLGVNFLSIFMQVERHREIMVRYQDLLGERHEVHATEDRNLSELLQHEIDHLDGILAVDRITDIRTMCAREEFEKRYRAESPYAAAAAGKDASKE